MPRTAMRWPACSGLPGTSVTREYYFNDAGTQIERLGESIRARARGEEVPEGGYVGDYVSGLAAQIPGAAEMRRPRARAHRRRADVRAHQGHAARLPRRVRRLLQRGARCTKAARAPIERGIQRLSEEGHLYRAEGALWLRTTDFGDDKDRVLERSTGQTTYFAADVAYAEHKLERGFDLLVIPLGSDHHGYVARLKANMAALGADPDRLEIPILQFVHIVEGGSRASMSKRRGEFITLDDLIGEIGVDATRYFMLSRSQDSTIDLDLDLARSQSAENPVYYVQYAHARIASVRRKAGEERVARALATTGLDVELHPSERALVKKLLAFPEEVVEAAERRAPHRIAAYALDLAQVFTAFYRDCLVVGAEPVGLEDWRLRLSVVTQRTIARALDLLGVEAPDEM